jgi:hypothetical protein
VAGPGFEVERRRISRRSSGIGTVVTTFAQSPETEKDREKNETQHGVTISKPFYMGINRGGRKRDRYGVFL